jgi:ATP-dependent Clp protease ATP-binding subunit ClpA
VFERFTSQARSSVAAAQDEARVRHADSIEPVHLLLALTSDDGRGGRVLRAAGADPVSLAAAVARVGGPLDADALAAVGIDLDRVRAATEAAFGPGALEAGGRSRSGHIPFAAASKRTLAEAVQLAARTRAGQIDSGHLLFGVLSVDDPVVDRVLRSLGADAGDLRRRVVGEADAA